MDKNDIDIINNIFDIDKKIYNVYVKLGELEENENVDLYNKYKLMLKILISSENNLFDSFGNSYERLSGLLEYIGSLTAPDFASSPIYAICDYDNAKYLSYYRMYEKIKMILMNDNQFVSDNLDTDLKIFESNKDESLNYIKIMNYNLAREYRRMNMLFLNECDDLRVVKRKYLYSFVSPLIEDEMLKVGVIDACSSLNIDDLKFGTIPSEEDPSKNDIVITPDLTLAQQRLASYYCYIAYLEKLKLSLNQDAINFSTLTFSIKGLEKRPEAINDQIYLVKRYLSSYEDKLNGSNAILGTAVQYGGGN